VDGSLNGKPSAKSNSRTIFGGTIAHPSFLTPSEFDTWLDPETPADRLTELLDPAADDFLEAVAVSKLVGSPKNEGPVLMEPVEAQ